jgi:hypothetical protein
MAGAYARAEELLRDAFAEVGHFPHGDLIPLEGEGAEFVWRSGDYHLRLFLAQDKPEGDYLYQALTEGREIKYSAVWPANSDCLRSLAHWFLERPVPLPEDSCVPSIPA